jgi:hypothetical protein
MAKVSDGRFERGAGVRQTGATISRRPRNQDVQRGLNGTAVRRRGDPSSKENHEMAAQKGTKTMTLGPDHEEPAPEFFGQRKRPENGQFRLQVDRHT